MSEQEFNDAWKLPLVEPSSLIEMANQRGILANVFEDVKYAGGVAVIRAEIERNGMKMDIVWNAKNKQYGLHPIKDNKELLAINIAPLSKLLDDFVTRSYIDWTKAKNLDGHKSIRALGVATINDVDSENVYVVKDGNPYYFKPVTTDTYAVGEHDFSNDNAYGESENDNKVSDLSHFDIGLFTMFIPNTKAGEVAWNEMANETDGTGKVLSIHAESVINQLRASGYTITKGKRSTLKYDDDAMLAELGKSIDIKWSMLKRQGLSASEFAVLLVQAGVIKGEYTSKKEQLLNNFGMTNEQYTSSMSYLTSAGMLDGRGNTTDISNGAIKSIADEYATMIGSDDNKLGLGFVFGVNGRAIHLLKPEIMAFPDDNQAASNVGAVNHETKHKTPIEVVNEGFNYQLLGRLKSDCDYFLGAGNGSEKHLWSGNVTDQISKMKEILESFQADGKPEWLTMNDVLKYENDMLLKLKLTNDEANQFSPNM